MPKPEVVNIWDYRKPEAYPRPAHEPATVIILPVVRIERRDDLKKGTIKMTKNLRALIPVALLFALFQIVAPARAQSIPGQFLVPLGYCQLSASQLGSSIGLASCVRASFTGTGSGTNLTTTSVTGAILPGDSVSGTGVPAGTTIVSQTSGTAHGAGVYVTSAATTSSGASLTSGGIPPGATTAVLQAETADIRYRDDGAAPTASIGMIVVHGAGGSLLYTGTLSALRFILLSGSPLLDVAFYR